MSLSPRKAVSLFGSVFKQSGQIMRTRSNKRRISRLFQTLLFSYDFFVLLENYQRLKERCVCYDVQPPCVVAEELKQARHALPSNLPFKRRAGL